MSRYKSIQTDYDLRKKKYVPLWRLDTTMATVIYFDAVICTTESKTYHTDYVHYHRSFSASHCPNRLRRLVNKGKIEHYLDELEQHVGNAIDRQVGLWKQSDNEYQTAVLANDIQKAAGLENCLVYIAREIMFDCMVYI